MKLIEKFKSTTKQEKTMIIIVFLLVICIITRWDYIKSEAGEAFKIRIERMKGAVTQPNTLKTDSLQTDVNTVTTNN